MLDARLAEWSAILGDSDGDGDGDGDGKGDGDSDGDGGDEGNDKGDGEILWRVTDVALISRSSKDDPFHGAVQRVACHGSLTFRFEQRQRSNLRDRTVLQV